MSGYCATGSEKNAIPPKSVMKIETTIAKIGRSMKKCERFIVARSVRLRFELDLAWLRRHLGAGPRPHEAVDHDTVAGGETGPDDAQVVVARTDAHHPGLDGAVVLHDHDLLLRLIGYHRGVRDQDRPIGLRAGYADPAELPGRQEEIGIWKHRSHADGAGKPVDLVVDEVELALVGPASFVGKVQGDTHFISARRLHKALLRGALVSEVIGLAHVEIEINGIQRDDGGEQRGAAALAAAHEIPDAHHVVADATGDRGLYLRELDIELRRADRGLGGFDRCCRDLHLRDALVVVGDGLETLVLEVRGALQLPLGKIE